METINRGKLPITAQTVLEIMNLAHAHGSAAYVELSIRTCQPVTRMTVENMANADQGSLGTLVLIVWLEKVIVSQSVNGNATAVEVTNTFH